MFCPRCGSNVPKGVRFCPSCGQELPESGPDEAPTGVPAQQQDSVVQNATSQRSTKPRVLVGVVSAACICAILAIVAVIWSMSGGSTSGLGSPTSQNSSQVNAATSGSGYSDGTAGTGASGNSTSGENMQVPVDASVSTPVGNLVNGGYVCEDDNSIYYATPLSSASDWFTNSIVRQSKDGSSKQVIYTTNATNPVVYHLNVASGRVFFTEVSDAGTQVKSVGTDGSSPQTLASADDSSLVQVYKGRIYFSQGGTLKVMDPNGSNVRDLMSVSGQLWRIYDDSIVHFGAQDATTVSKANLDGSGDHVFIRTTVDQNNEQITNVIPNPSTGVYEVLEGGKGETGGYGIIGYDSNGTKSYGLDGEAEGGSRIYRFNPTKDGMIFLYDHSAPDLGSDSTITPSDEHVVFEANGTQWTDPNDTLYDTNDPAVTLMSPTYIDGYVYFALIKSGSNALMRIPANGGTAELVA